MASKKRKIWDVILISLAILSFLFLAKAIFGYLVNKSFVDHFKDGTYNKAFEDILYPLGWQSVITPYYVADDIETIRNTIYIRDSDEQKQANMPNPMMRPDRPWEKYRVNLPSSPILISSGLPPCGFSKTIHFESSYSNQSYPVSFFEKDFGS